MRSRENAPSRSGGTQRHKHFGDSYRTAFDGLRKGVKEVVFPAGTFWMCRFAAALTEPRPAASKAPPA
jgi:hypothetical protein